MCPRVQSLDQTSGTCYDSQLRMDMPEESCLVEYVDDVVVLIASCAIDKLKRNGMM